MSTNTRYGRIKKKGKGVSYVHSWKSKGVYSSKLSPSYPAFGTKFDKDPLAVEQNNYTTNKMFTLSITFMLGQEILVTISNLKIACLMQLI